MKKSKSEMKNSNSEESFKIKSRKSMPKKGLERLRMG